MLSWYKSVFFRSNHFRSRFAIISCKLGGEGGGGGGEGNGEGKKKKGSPTTHRRRQILRENANNEIKMSCELNGGQERGILRWAERRAEWDLRGESGGRRALPGVCVCVCVCLCARVCARVSL